MALCPEALILAPYAWLPRHGGVRGPSFFRRRGHKPRGAPHGQIPSDFYAPHGNPLFSSVSNFDPAYYAGKRDLVAFGASFVKALGGIGRFAFDAKGYLDARASRLDYSYGFTFVLTPGLCRDHAPFRREYGAKAREE